MKDSDGLVQYCHGILNKLGDVVAGMPLCFAGGPVFSDEGEIVSCEFKASGYIKEFLDSPEISQRFKEVFRKNIEVYRKRSDVFGDVHMSQVGSNIQGLNTFECDNCEEIFEKLDMLIRHKQKLHKLGNDSFVSLPICDEVKITNGGKKSSSLHNSNKLKNILVATVSSNNIGPLASSSAPNQHLGTDMPSRPKVTGRKHDYSPGQKRSPRKQYLGEILPGDRPYSCQYCEKRFSKVGHLNVHETNHTGNKKYVCGYCPKSFNQIYHLKNHERIHTGEQPFQCSACGKVFSNNSALNVHRGVHTGSKRFKCSFCNRAFSQLGNLKVHERTHTGEQPFICYLCGKCFGSKWNLKTHEKKCKGIIVG